MKKVQNKNDIGNPYHNEDGTFGSPNGSDSSSLKKDVFQAIVSEPKKEEDDSFTIVPFDKDDIDSYLDTLGSTDLEKAETVIADSKPFSKVLNLKFEKSLSLEEKTEILNNSSQEYDKAKISHLSENELNALLIAEKALNFSKITEQQSILLDLKKKEITEQFDKEVTKEVWDHRDMYYSKNWDGLWINTPQITDFDIYYEKDASGTSKIERKREYFQNSLDVVNEEIKKYQEIIDDPFAFEDEINSAKSIIEGLQSAKTKVEDNIKRIDNFEQAGLHFKELKEQINVKYLNELEGIEAQISEYKKTLEQLATPEFNSFKNNAKNLIAAYQDEKAIYSQFRKNNAVWFKGSGVIQQAEKHFFPTAEKHYASMTVDEINRIDDYKSGSSKYNEPLRKITYVGGKNFQGKSYSQAINDMTNAIDKCEWDEDIWVQRGQSAHINCFMINGSKRSISSMTEAERNSLIGTMYVDNGFFSAGAGKGTGFSGESLIINAYCPKGTKMVYAQYRPGYKNENEMILQRGYSYRITKIEKSGSKYYMDVEVILNSDKNKPIGSDLVNIEKTLYKPY